MKAIIKYLFVIFMLNCTTVYGQKTSVEYELNGKNIEDVSNNPFGKFIGEWTLKGDNWLHNWGYGTEAIKIPNHHTVSTQLNTDNSLLSIIDGPQPNGHIFWSFNPNTKEVFHLSSFGTIRAGNGRGTLDAKGNVALKLSFEGEPKGTYRLYNYTWVNENEYHMKSIQYDENGEPTGLFYEGTFIRISSTKTELLRKEIVEILKVLDNNDISIDEQLKVYTDDVIHMAPNNQVIQDKNSLKTYLQQQRTYGVSKMAHEIIEIEDLGGAILLRGAVTGDFYPSNGDKPIAFATKNLFVFKKINGKLRITKVIYNMTPTQ